MNIIILPTEQYKQSLITNTTPQGWYKVTKDGLNIIFEYIHDEDSIEMDNVKYYNETNIDKNEIIKLKE